MIQLIVGLGNPGEEHVHDRHNAGFWLCDLIASQYRSAFTKQTAFKGHLSKIVTKNQTLYLLKPQTFMNLSGESIGAVARFYHIPTNQILVIHDELDLSAGMTKLKFAGGTGGHNGLKSTTQHLGTPDYWRLRVGIGHPRNLVPVGTPYQEVANYVLKRPSSLDQNAIDQSFEKFLQVLPQLVSGDPEGAMKALHTS